MAAISSENSVADRDTKNTAPTDLCCAPRAQLSEDWGYVTPPAPWRRRP